MWISQERTRLQSCMHLTALEVTRWLLKERQVNNFRCWYQMHDISSQRYVWPFTTLAFRSTAERTVTFDCKTGWKLSEEEGQGQWDNNNNNNAPNLTTTKLALALAEATPWNYMIVSVVLTSEMNMLGCAVHGAEFKLLNWQRLYQTYTVIYFSASCGFMCIFLIYIRETSLFQKPPAHFNVSTQGHCCFIHLISHLLFCEPIVFGSSNGYNPAVWEISGQLYWQWPCAKLQNVPDKTAMIGWVRKLGKRDVPLTQN